MLYERFIGGHEDLEDDPRCGHLSFSQNEKVVAKVCELVTRDHCMSLKLLEDWLHINWETVHQICYKDVRNRNLCKAPHSVIVDILP